MFWHRDEMYCPHCGTVAVPKRDNRGSFLLGLALFFFFIVPGILYGLWQLTTGYNACAVCGMDGLLPLDSPRARSELRRLAAQ